MYFRRVCALTSKNEAGLKLELEFETSYSMYERLIRTCSTLELVLVSIEVTTSGVYDHFFQTGRNKLLLSIIYVRDKSRSGIDNVYNGAEPVQEVYNFIKWCTHWKENKKRPSQRFVILLNESLLSTYSSLYVFEFIEYMKNNWLELNLGTKKLISNPWKLLYGAMLHHPNL